MINPASLPPDLQQIIAGETPVPMTQGYSGAQVWKFGQRYLKITPRNFIRNLRPEMERIRWLQGKLPVPQLVYYGEDADNEYLLISEVPGLPSYDKSFSDDVETVVRLLAQGLQIIHALPIPDCPFDQRLDVQLQAAYRNMQNGEVDADDFDEGNQGRPVEALYADLLASRPAAEDMVFTHGDYCLPNILINPQTMQLTGFIDLGRAGVADRYQDLALCARSIDYNWGAEYIPLLFEAYGTHTIDADKIRYYKLLDEFF